MSPEASAFQGAGLGLLGLLKPPTIAPSTLCGAPLGCWEKCQVGSTLLPTVDPPPPIQPALLAGFCHRGTDRPRELSSSRCQRELVSALGPLGHIQRNHFHIADQVLDDLGQLEGGTLDSGQAIARSAWVIH
jgi:hypothetical protein